MTETIEGLLKAIEFATLKHHGQMRKHIGEPYIVHCLRVAQLVTHVGEPAISAAILHDTVEDTDTTYDELQEIFGTVIADVVMELTDPPAGAGNRATRKQIARDQVKSHYAKCVKLADTLDNLPSIKEHDPDFYRVYCDEMKLSMPLLQDGDKKLFSAVLAMIGTACVADPVTICPHPQRDCHTCYVALHRKK